MQKLIIAVKLCPKNGGKQRQKQPNRHDWMDASRKEKQHQAYARGHIEKRRNQQFGYSLFEC